MKHLLQQTMQRKTGVTYDMYGDPSTGSLETFPCRWVNQDSSVLDTGSNNGAARQLHAKVWVTGEVELKADDILVYNSTEYVVWEVRDKVDGQGNVLFKTADVYRQNTAT